MSRPKYRPDDGRHPVGAQVWVKQFLPTGGSKRIRGKVISIPHEGARNVLRSDGVTSTYSLRNLRVEDPSNDSRS